MFSRLPKYQNVNCREIVNNLIEDQARDLALNRADWQSRTLFPAKLTLLWLKDSDQTAL